MSKDDKGSHLRVTRDGKYESRHDQESTNSEERRWYIMIVRV